MQALDADLNDIAGNELRASRRARLRNVIQALVVFAGLSAYAVFFYRDLLFTDHVYVFRDMYTMWFAFEHTVQTMARWHWPPLWDPFAALGRPFAADLMAAVYYTLNWVLRQLPEARGFNISIAVHHLIAAAGVFVLLRYRRLSVIPAALAAAFAIAARTHPRMAGVAFLLLAAADLYRVNGQLLPTVPWTAVQRRPRTVEVMERGEDPLRIYSDGLGRTVVPPFPDGFIQEQNLLFMQDASYYLIGNLNAPNSVTLSDHEALEEMIESSPRERSGTVLGMFNVAYVTSPKDLRRPGLRMVQSPRDALEAYVFAVEPHAARAFAPARLHATWTREQAIDYLMHQAAPSEVTLMAESVPAGLGAEMAGTVRIVSYLPERVELLAQMHTAGLVVLSDTYYPGWQATIDGAPTAVVRANYFARGVYVNAGVYAIVFRYAPLSFRAGAVVSGLTCGALVLCLGWTRRRWRRQPSSMSPCSRVSTDMRARAQESRLGFTAAAPGLP